MLQHTLEMRNVTKRFPGVLALDDVSLKLSSGEILAICGENGAGKSTLMKVLSGMYTSHEYEGDIIFDGEKVEHMNVAKAREIGEQYGVPYSGGAAFAPLPATYPRYAYPDAGAMLLSETVVPDAALGLAFPFVQRSVALLPTAVLPLMSL